MTILITGICGFVGSTVARALQEQLEGVDILGIDNFSRCGAYENRQSLEGRGIKVHAGDIRNASDVEALPPADWVVDAAANPSVLAGVDGQTGPRQLLEHNLYSTVNLLEYCRHHGSGFLLVSTSRVYSVNALAQVPVGAGSSSFILDGSGDLPTGLSTQGIAESFSTSAPVSLYGATKLASETLALEYSEAYGFPVWINRCGVLAGAGQFGRPDQGIVSFWINSWLGRHPLKYIGFGGTGHQVRDCFHPRDLSRLLVQQMEFAGGERRRVINLGGGLDNAFSLLELSQWCEAQIGPHEVQSSQQERPYDAPWIVMDNAVAQAEWGWSPEISAVDIFQETLEHGRNNPDWLHVSGVR